MFNPLYFFHRLNSEAKRTISENFSFYNNLSKNNKRKFEYRVSVFIGEHNFIGRAKFVITPISRVIIASIAVMLTFKMSRYLYKQFKNTIVYPKNYLSQITNKIHRGETNSKLRAIVFSWEGIIEGIQAEDDNLNLGIHKFTHALYFSFQVSSSSEANNFISNFKSIIHYLNNTQRKTQLLNANYFRNYAFENQYEFLSVITENYFETPDIFKLQLPELFLLVNKLYRIYSSVPKENIIVN